MTKYSELHLFIDESGDFIKNRKRDFLLIGGVLLFGQYDAAVEDGIKNAMLDACRLSGAKYPVHYNELAQTQIKSFSQYISENLTDWRKRTETPIYGVFIQHKEDVFYDAADILSEQSFDNRYVSMLWTLVEYLCFVSDKVNSRLTDDAEIHLHIASRQFYIPKDEDLRELYESLGYMVKENKRDANSYFVTATLRQSDIAAMFRIALRSRWNKSNRSLASVSVDGMQYQNKNASAVMYLSDIILGVERKRIQDYGVQAQQTVPILEALEYGKTLESAIKCRSYIAEDNMTALLGSLADNPFAPADLRNQGIVNKLAALFKQSKTPFYQLYETALRNVNHPFYRKKGLQLQTLLDAVHEKSQLNDLQTYLHTLQIDMAYHDHTGNVELGNYDWEQYLELEPQLATLGAEQAMEFYTDFRCKRAVNLMDEFRYDEAAKVLIQAETKEENFVNNAVKMFGGNANDFPKERRGWVYSSRGQVFAFQGRKALAEQCFRDALKCFDKQDDIEREWVYLGHLTCDFPHDSQDLLNDVFENLPSNTSPFEEPFILALKLKAVYVFGDTEQQTDWAEQMLTFIRNNEETLPTDHPWGLIYQMTAMLFEKINNKNQANHFYDLALDSFRKGEGILKELGKYCQLRKQGKPAPEKIRFNYW
ncbi:MAG: hypothetical protein LBT05_11255 [Planctomycetaceae bacterium]|jgi:hypothetical protein|nr:hypothetical protein [Planctomycetaceae bacterium]